MKKEKSHCSQGNTRNVFGILGVFLLFLSSGFIFRYGIEIIETWKNYLIGKISLDIEDMNRENQKRWSVVKAEYPIKQEGLVYDDENAIELHVGHEDIDDYEDGDYEDE